MSNLNTAKRKGERRKVYSIDLFRHRGIVGTVDGFGRRGSFVVKSEPNPVIRFGRDVKAGSEGRPAPDSLWVIADV